MKDAEKSVSIITPAFNAQSTIEDTLESVRLQSYTNWELLVVDDCSTDSTRDLVRKRGELDARVRLIERPVNGGGPSRARQAALDAASGRYVAFLDSDDLWLPQKLERQLAFMKASEAALSYTEYRRISADGLRVGKRVRVPKRLGYNALLRNTAIATSTVMVDRLKTGPLTMTHTYYDDFALWLSILRRGWIAYGLKEDLMRYRVAADSWSRNKKKSVRLVWRAYREVEQLSLTRSAWCFANYAWHAVLKYRAF